MNVTEVRGEADKAQRSNVDNDKLETWEQKDYTDQLTTLKGQNIYE